VVPPRRRAVRPREARDAGVAACHRHTGDGHRSRGDGSCSRRDREMHADRRACRAGPGAGGLAITETNEPGPGLRFWEPQVSEPVPVAAIRAAALCGRGAPTRS
jgi:hypothetical protein